MESTKTYVNSPISFSHKAPSYPSGQAQRNVSSSSKQVPLTHGEESQGVGVGTGVVGARNIIKSAMKFDTEMEESAIEC